MWFGLLVKYDLLEAYFRQENCYSKRTHIHVCSQKSTKGKKKVNYEATRSYRLSYSLSVSNNKQIYIALYPTYSPRRFCGIPNYNLRGLQIRVVIALLDAVDFILAYNFKEIVIVRAKAILLLCCIDHATVCRCTFGTLQQRQSTNQGQIHLLIALCNNVDMQPK